MDLGRIASYRPDPCRAAASRAACASATSRPAHARRGVINASPIWSSAPSLPAAAKDQHTRRASPRLQTASGCGSSPNSTACATARPRIASSRARALPKSRAAPTTDPRWAYFTTSTNRNAANLRARLEEFTPAGMDAEFFTPARRDSMKADLTRVTFNPLKHFTPRAHATGPGATRRRLERAGRQILLHYLQALAADLIGPHGGPIQQLRLRDHTGRLFDKKLDFRIGVGTLLRGRLAVRGGIDPIGIFVTTAAAAGTGGPFRSTTWTPGRSRAARPISSSSCSTMCRAPFTPIVVQITNPGQSEPLNSRCRACRIRSKTPKTPKLRRVITYLHQPDYLVPPTPPTPAPALPSLSRRMGAPGFIRRGRQHSGSRARRSRYSRTRQARMASEGDGARLGGPALTVASTQRALSNRRHRGRAEGDGQGEQSSFTDPCTIPARRAVPRSGKSALSS